VTVYDLSANLTAWKIMVIPKVCRGLISGITPNTVSPTSPLDADANPENLTFEDIPNSFEAKMSTLSRAVTKAHAFGAQ
jgi:hypothetical protein